METATVRREVEIDTKLAELWTLASQARRGIENARLSLASDLGIRPYYVTRNRREVRETMAELLLLAEALLAGDVTPWKRQEVERTIARLNDAKAELAQAREEAAPSEAVYAEEQWSRFFLVTSSAGGHIHSHMSCSTCRLTTEFVWLPDLSGLTVKDAVEAHGPLLCSVCYPSAPVEWTVGHVKDETDKCPGSGEYVSNPSRRRYLPCPSCGESVSVTSTGKLRAHKKAGA